LWYNEPDMELPLIYVLGGALVVLGFVGCVVPVLPGPVVGYAALWIPTLFGRGLPASTLWAGAGITAVALGVDYFLPAVCAKKFKCTKSGVVGCVLGTIVGLFFLPLGLILGPFLGTMVGELTAGRNLAEAVHGGIGAFLGFVTGTLAKLLAVGLLGWLFFTASEL